MKEANKPEIWNNSIKQQEEKNRPIEETSMRNATAFAHRICSTKLEGR
jgi:hypothetical protein